MSEISISLNIINVDSAPVNLPLSIPLGNALSAILERAGLQQALGAFSDVTPDALGECLVVVSRPVERTDSTLYELGIRTGDVLTIAANNAEIDHNSVALVNVFRDSGDTIEVSDHMPLAGILPLLWRAEGQDGEFSLEQVHVLCGRPVTNLNLTARQLGVRIGDMISLVKVRMGSSRVTLILASPRGQHPPFKVDYSPAVLGRFDRNLIDQPLDLDLARVLPRGKDRAVSRRQAEFSEESGVWSVQLHKDASVPMFVDNQRVTAERPIALAENNVLSFGYSPNQPDFQLVVRFETD